MSVLMNNDRGEAFPAGAAVSRQRMTSPGRGFHGDFPAAADVCHHLAGVTEAEGLPRGRSCLCDSVRVLVCACVFASCVHMCVWMSMWVGVGGGGCVRACVCACVRACACAHPIF